MPRKTTVPAYGHHVGRDLVRVIIDGKHIHLGPYGSEESKVKYEQIVRKYLTDRAASEMKARVEVSTDLRVIELVTAYLKFARGYYVKHGVPTPEYTHIYSALKPLQETYGEEFVTSFGPIKL